MCVRWVQMLPIWRSSAWGSREGVNIPFKLMTSRILAGSAVGVEGVDEEGLVPVLEEGEKAGVQQRMRVCCGVVRGRGADVLWPSFQSLSPALGARL